MTQHISALQTATVAANAAEDKKSRNVLILDTAQVSNLADYFVICSGENQTQVQAIAESIRKIMATYALSPMGIERDRLGRWILLDYGDVVIHVLHQEDRAFYQLEQFWNHAEPVLRENWAHLPAQSFQQAS